MKALCCVILVLCFGGTYAQTRETGTENNEDPVYNDISGTPYLLRDWSEGVIRFSSGRVTDQFKVKFDCVRNIVMLQFNGSTFATESKIKEFVIYTKSGKVKDSMVFRKGYPPVDRANEETFYQVMLEGKTTLLLLHVKQIADEQQIASKVIYRRIKDEKAYYLLNQGLMISLPSDRTIISEKFFGQYNTIRQFISEHQLKFRDAEDFRKLVVYYNSLL